MFGVADLRPAGWLLAGVGSALLVRATMPPYDLSPLALGAWAPLLVLVGRVPLRILLLAASLQGVLLNLSAHTSIIGGLRETISASFPAAVGAWLLLALWQGLRTPLVLLVVHFAVRFRCPLWLAFPVVQAAVEDPLSAFVSVDARPRGARRGAMAPARVARRIRRRQPVARSRQRTGCRRMVFTARARGRGAPSRTGGPRRRCHVGVRLVGARARGRS